MVKTKMKPAAVVVEVLVDADGYRLIFHCDRLIVLVGAHEVSSLVATIFINGLTLPPAPLDWRPFPLVQECLRQDWRGLILPSQELEVVDCDGVCSHSVDTLQQDRVGADGHLGISTEVGNDDVSAEIGGSDPK